MKTATLPFILRNAKRFPTTRDLLQRKSKVRMESVGQCTIFWNKRTNSCAKKIKCTKPTGCVRILSHRNTERLSFLDKPPPAAINYFIDIGKLLSGAKLDDSDQDQGEKLENILSALEMDEKELKSCEHPTDITKTCRHIVKYKYRNDKNLGKMRVAAMNADVIDAIRSKGWNHWISMNSYSFSRLCSLGSSCSGANHGFGAQ